MEAARYVGERLTARPWSGLQFLHPRDLPCPVGDTVAGLRWNNGERPLDCAGVAEGALKRGRHLAVAVGIEIRIESPVQVAALLPDEMDLKKTKIKILYWS